jgi:hypothetical protein
MPRLHPPASWTRPAVQPLPHLPHTHAIQISAADPDLGKNKDPGSGINIPEHISESLVITILGYKYLNCLAIQCTGSGIRCLFEAS